MEVEALVKLPVMEDYYTIQGEGFNTGQAAHFIRLGGCDVGCVWCDVKESWDASAHPLLAVKDIVNKSLQYKAETVVITGGEPLMYDLEDLCKKFHDNTIQTFIETSGAYPLSGSWDWICVSPKKFKPPLVEVLNEADELKVVVYNKSDFAWGEHHAANVSEKCHLYFQPEWSRFKEIMPEIIAYVKKNPRWRISLQTHKFMDIP